MAWAVGAVQWIRSGPVWKRWVGSKGIMGIWVARKLFKAHTVSRSDWGRRGLVLIRGTNMEAKGKVVAALVNRVRA